ncbi:MAG: hypothetical protein WC843_02770 [Candidatus Gracilibacteria bacterium]|jgi:hypothetical protein
MSIVTFNCKECQKPSSYEQEDWDCFKKFGFEPQELCFECDQKQRLCFRNERALYTRKCDATGETIISIYSSDKPYKVYKSDYWYGDKWDALSYGRDFDFNRPFFEQFKELQLQVPRLALTNINAVNSDYCNSAYGNKDSYLIFGGDFNQNCLFGTLCMSNVGSLDLDYSNFNELCYVMGDTLNSYGCRVTFDSKNCNNCYFISDCIGCSECILCTNLANQSYCINNQKYSKEEYLQKKQELINGSYVQQQKNFGDFLDLLKKRKVKYIHTVSCQDCSGDYIKNSKNCKNCFDVSESQDLRNIIFASKEKDCFQSCLLGDDAELLYQCVSVMKCYNIQFSFFIADSSNIQYCDFIQNSQNLLGCTGLKNQQYCILNKKYSKEDYEKLYAKIVEHMKKNGEWGKFLPKDLACFGYNESTSSAYYPLTKEQALKEKFQWKDEDEKTAQPQRLKIPDQIKDFTDAMVNEILLCLDCHKNFKIVNQELQFYRKMDIPVPRICSECRHKQRMQIRNPRQLFERICSNCSKKLQSTYAPKRPETVLCEECYLKEIY